MSRTTTSASGDIKVEKHRTKWDPKTLEIRTHSVEKTLEPLVHQVRAFFFMLSLRPYAWRESNESIMNYCTLSRKRY